MRWPQAVQSLPLLPSLQGHGNGKSCSAGSSSLGLPQLHPRQPGHPHWAHRARTGREPGQEGSQKHLEGRTGGHTLLWDGRDIKAPHSRGATTGIVYPGTTTLSTIILCIPIELGAVSNLKRCTDLFFLFPLYKGTFFSHLITQRGTQRMILGLQYLCQQQQRLQM